jgi:hypothetical protein
MRIYAYLAVAAAAIAVVWIAYAQGKDAGKAQCEARVAAAVEAARRDESKRDQAAAQAGIDMLDYLSRMTDKIEVSRGETIERIRTIYRDRPVPAECKWPDGMRAELDAAVRRANTTAH